MEQRNNEEIVGAKVDQACEMDTQDSVISPSLMLSSSPHLSFQSTDLPLVVSCLQTEPLKISGFDSRENDNCLNSSREDSPRTPQDAMFDPFAYLPERPLLAPFVRKCRTSTLILDSTLRCNLTEQYESDAERICDYMLVEDVCDDLLEAIMAKRAQEISVSDDRCMTPTFENGVDDAAENCPDAPARTTETLKHTGKASSKKKLDFNAAGLCRKLEF